LLHDLARVFEYPVAEIMIISKKLDDKNLDQMSIEEIIKACPEFGTWMEHHKVDNVEQHIRNLNGVVRHKGTHAAGVLISGDPLWENFPIERVSNNLVSAFCDGGRSKELMSLGGVKFDILGLNTLQVHKDCAKNIATRKGKNWKELINLFDASQIDDADAKVFNSIFKTGDTCDIFQFESKVAQQLLIDIQPDNVQELGIINAINRPGPLQGGYDRLYINSKFSGIRTKIHPIVDAILDETHGAMIYQEQVIKIARQLGDLTDEEAELFRKLAFKLDRQKNVDVADARMQRILEIIAKWRESAIKKGMTEKAVDDLWKKIEGFLDYAFNKAHAISYSMVGYVSAFMKTYYPIEFHTAYLNNITNDTEKVRFYIKYLRNKGYSIIPPRFDHKIGIDCSVVDDKTIMLGLSIVKNVKAELIVDFIENNRKTITSLKELFIQIQESNGIGKRTIESLILIGFFDNLPVNETVTKMSRAKLGLLYGQWHDSHKPKFKKIEGSKEKLAKIIKKMDEQVDEIVLQDEPKFDPYLVETNLMQFSLTEHPLMKYADIMGPTREKFADFNVVLGEITSMQFKFSKNKKRFAIVIVSDVETHKTHKIMIWDNLIKSYNFQVGDCGIFIITEAHPQFGTCELSQYIK
jgi:DNA polymerase-3 subunit alpha